MYRRIRGHLVPMQLSNHPPSEPPPWEERDAEQREETEQRWRAGLRTGRTKTPRKQGKENKELSVAQKPGWPGWRLWSPPAWYWLWPANKPQPRFWVENRRAGAWACETPSQHPWESSDSPAHLDRASLWGGSSCHFVFGTGNSKEPQAAAAGLFPPSLPCLTCVKTSCWRISKAPSEATFSAVSSSVCHFTAGPGWTKPLSYGCGFSLWRQRDAAPFPY